MTFLAYIDVRPFLFLAGLPIFILLTLLVCWLVRAKVNKGKAALISSLVFSGLFAFFLTGFGPFVNQTEIREYVMTWEIKPPPSDGTKGSEVVLSFVDFPGHYIGQYSDELAEHLRANGKEQVKVVFDVTSDYGRVRGLSETEIAGLTSWHSNGGYAGTRGTPSKSPWD
jgi:predicted PurR-regulated permease PerM